jgi:predicted nucleotide-binding protein (sugar kinase/HSP70/actin superfamily)
MIQNELTSQKNEHTHYKRKNENPFTREQRQFTTVLLGGLSSLADRFLANSLIGLGYRANHLPVPDMNSMNRGKEFCDNGLCNPAYFTIGNLIAYLQKLMENGITKEDIINNYIFVTAGSCGPCRFGMYEYEYRLSLDNAGFNGFRIIVFQMAGALNQDDKISGLKLDFEFFRAVLNSFVLSDHLNDLKNQIKPYEVKPGETDSVIEICAEQISAYLRTKKPLRGEKISLDNDSTPGFEIIRNIIDQFTSRNLNKLLKRCRKELAKIQVDYSKIKPIVKITGEFWAQTTEGDGNYQIFNFLHEEGCEIIIEPVSSWVMYLIWLEKTNQEEKSMTLKKSRIGMKTPLLFTRYYFKKIKENLQFNAGTFIYRYFYTKVGKKMGGKSRKLLSVDSLVKYAQPYINVKYDGGEGFLEVAKNIYYTSHNLCHMVLSVKPFGCMPSTISDSIQARVTADFDNMVFLPLETSGEGKINALSRVQMALNEARARAVREYEIARDKIIIQKNKKLPTEKKQYGAFQKLPAYNGSSLKAAGYLKKIAKGI